MSVQTVTRGRRGGFTLVEAVIVAALLAAVAGGIYRAGIAVMGNIRRANNTRTALNLLQQQVEYVRSLDFYRIGTHPQTGVAYFNRVVTTNDTYNANQDVLLTRTDTLTGNIMAELTTYATPYDDPVDGLGADDRDGDTRDALIVRVVIRWTDRGQEQTRSLETMLYGTISDDREFDAVGVNPEDNPSDGDGDPGVVDILLAEYKLKDQEINVRATDYSKGTNTLTLVGYGTMSYEKKKDVWLFQSKKAAYPGDSVRVRSSTGEEDTLPVKYLK